MAETKWSFYSVLSFVLFETLSLQAMFLDSELENHQGLRHLRSAGFEAIGAATVTEIDILTGQQTRFNHEALRMRRSAGEDGDIHLAVKLDSGNEEFTLKLRHARSVVHPAAKLIRTRGEHEEHMVKRDINCFLTHQNGEGLAVISYCRNTRGIFTHNGDEYAIDPLEEDENEVVKRSVNSHRVLIAKRQAENTFEDFEAEVESLVRDKRATVVVDRPDLFEIETGLIMDEDMVNYLKDNRNLQTYDEWLEYMLIKWTGVQAIWSDASLIGYDVKITLKYINFWEENPPWYTSTIKVGATTRLVCDHIRGDTENDWPYDHIQLQLGRKDGSPLGMSWVGGICSGLKCSGIRKRDCFSIKGPAHEIGHNLGLKHNDPSKDYCGPGDGGMMGYGFVGLSSCNRARLTSYITKSPKYDCLFEENVDSPPVDIALDTEYSGQNTLPDDLCATTYGAGYFHRPSPTVCSSFICDYLGDGPLFGITKSSSPVPRGISCGNRQMCIHKDCEYWENSGRNVQELEAALVVGGWSDWGSWSVCSRTCGTGVKIARRTCNNPTPVNSPVCEGLAFKAELCSQTPCPGDSLATRDQQVIRASEVCEKKITDGLISGDVYSGIGTWKNGASLGEDNVCKLRCAIVEGGYGSTDISLGIMPSGTPCNEESEALGNSFRCVYGYCLEFGCDGILVVDGGAYYDKCGVCGGDDTSCDVVTGSFTEPGSKGTRLTIMTLPAGAYHISFKHTNYMSQRYTYLEMWSKDDVVAISVKLLNDKDTDDTPILFAGAYWNYNFKTGFNTEDAISEPIIMKLHIAGKNPNKEIAYSYAIPTDISSCTGSCSNGGVWENCGCTCTDGFYGPTCDSECDTICRNGQPYDENTCTCTCGERMYGDKCECKNAYKGEQCSLCKIEGCDNCGTFDEASCRCECPDGYGGLGCTDQCEDVAVDCETMSQNGGCDGSHSMETECMATCGLCTPLANPPSPVC